MTQKFLAPSVRGPGGPRRESGIRLSCHIDADEHGVARDENGLAIPAKMNGKRPLWRFLARAEGKLKAKLKARHDPTSRTFFAAGWDDANGVVAKLADEWSRLPNKACIVYTVAEVVEKFLSMKSREGSTTRPATVAAYRQRLAHSVIPAFGSRDIRSLTPDDATWYRKKYASKGAMRTRQMQIDMLSAIVNFAVAYDLLDKSPMRPEHRITVAKRGTRSGTVDGDARVARAFDPDKELLQIVNALNQDDVALVAMVRWMSWSGARLREALHVRTVDIAFAEDGSAFVTIATNFPCPCEHCSRNGGLRETKNGKARLVPLHPSLVAPMRAYLAARAEYFKDRQPTPWAFPMWLRRGSSHATIGGVRVGQVFGRAFRAAVEQAGFTDIRPHDVRSSAHTAWLLQKGPVAVNPVAVDYAFGHAMPGSAMNAIYTQFDQQPSSFYQACFPAWRPKLVLAAGGFQTDVRKVG